MLIISFAWTTPALLALVKNRTRRNWTEEYAARFREGMYCQGYDRNPRNGGRPVATVYLNCTPYRESTAKMTEDDYRGEGLQWMEDNRYLVRGVEPRRFFEDWKRSAEVLYVVRFQIVEIKESLRAYLTRVWADMPQRAD